MKINSTYQELKPRKDLSDFIDSFWTHENKSDQDQPMTILPDSYFKIVMVIQNNKIVKYFMTGFWTGPLNFNITKKTKVFGCRFKILAPEYLLKREVASIINSFHQLELDYLSIKKFDTNNFEILVDQWQNELIDQMPKKELHGHKLRLSQLLDKMRGDISASEVSNQIFWSNKQINRYLNRYIGLSLKKYLNLQKVYNAYIQIREGDFFPEKGYFDQAHFSREVRKHTNNSPSNIHAEQNERLIQIKNIVKK